jgi:hypothetical protein
MNQADAVKELRRRGYTGTMADLAIFQAGQNGAYNLHRHRVVLLGDGSYQITPRPWADDPGAQVLSPAPDGLKAPASASLDEILDTIETVDAHLDSSANPEYRAQPLAQDWARITKVCEEAGEVWKAHSRLTGENPRKRQDPATTEDLLGELGDTASAALCAIQHVTKDTNATWRIFTEALAKARSRVPAGSPFPPASGMDEQAARDNGITG